MCKQSSRGPCSFWFWEGSYLFFAFLQWDILEPGDCDYLRVAYQVTSCWQEDAAHGSPQAQGSLPGKIPAAQLSRSCHPTGCARHQLAKCSLAQSKAISGSMTDVKLWTGTGQNWSMCWPSFITLDTASVPSIPPWQNIFWSVCVNNPPPAPNAGVLTAIPPTVQYRIFF